VVNPVREPLWIIRNGFNNLPQIAKSTANNGSTANKSYTDFNGNFFTGKMPPPSVEVGEGQFGGGMSDDVYINGNGAIPVVCSIRMVKLNVSTSTAYITEGITEAGGTVTWSDGTNSGVIDPANLPSVAENSDITLEVAENFGYIFKGLKTPFGDRSSLIFTTQVTAAKNTFVALFEEIPPNTYDASEGWDGLAAHINAYKADPANAGKGSAENPLDIVIVKAKDDINSTYFSVDDYYSLDMSDTSNKITNIGEFAFRNDDKLVGVTLNSNCLKINKSAFLDCDNLVSVSLPGVTEIGNAGFNSCNVLENVYAPSVKTIGEQAFQSCTALTTVVTGTSLTKIGNYAFAQSGITSIPNMVSLTTIGSSAFYKCLGLYGTITLNCAKIPEQAFIECSGITEVDLSNVTEIGPEAFSTCGNLKTVTMGKTGATVADNAFPTVTGTGFIAAYTHATTGGAGTYNLVSGSWTK
jgi:hypothetical protein